MRKIILKEVLSSQEINTLRQFLRRRDLIWDEKIKKVNMVVTEQMRTINGSYVPYQVEKGMWATNIRVLKEIQEYLVKFIKERNCPTFTCNIVKIEKILREFIDSYK